MKRHEFHQRTSCIWRQKTKAAPWMPDESYQEATHTESQKQVCVCAATRMFSFFLSASVYVLPAAMLRWSSGVFSRLLDHNAVSTALCLHFSSRGHTLFLAFQLSKVFLDPFADTATSVDPSRTFCAAILEGVILGVSCFAPCRLRLLRSHRSPPPCVLCCSLFGTNRVPGCLFAVPASNATLPRRTKSSIR